MDDMFIRFEYGEFLELDLHGKSINEAQIELLHAINIADLKYNGILVVHGFNSGTSLKNYVRNDFTNSNVIEKIKVDAGRTLLLLKR